MDDCIFCKIASGAMPSKKVFEDDEILAFHDIKPLAEVHILFITKHHYADVREIKDPAFIGRIVQRATKIAEDFPQAKKGFRLVTNSGAEAGQTVFHFHLHLFAGKFHGRAPAAADA